METNSILVPTSSCIILEMCNKIPKTILNFMSYYCAQQSALFSFFNDLHNECVNYSIQITLKIVVNHQEVVDLISGLRKLSMIQLH